MAQGSALQSFIPYLDGTAHPFALQVSFPDQSHSLSRNQPDPFVILRDAEPLTRLFMGKVVTKTGNPLKDLYLLTQRDEYQLSHPPSAPFNNIDIEHSWQEAARRFTGSHRAAFSFAARPTDDNGILPFRSLFYCSFRDLFFHPLCPMCGELLELCIDDETLATAGLSPYSSSLRRYLYCPACIDAGNKSMFFAPRRQDGDPSGLAHLHNLIKGFGEVPGNAKGSFPCSSCPESGACFGPEEKAQGRILPFSFFPFHLVAFDSYPFDAIDYLKAPSPKAATPAAEGREKPRREAEPRPDAHVEGPEQETVAVTDVLLAIRKKWEAAIPKPDEQPAAREAKEVPEQEIKKLPVDMLEKTMIFSPGEMGINPLTAETPTEQEATSAPPPEPPQAPSREVALEKTMIFSPGTIPKTPSTLEKRPEKAPPAAPPEPRQPAPGEILKKTMISTPDGEKHDAPEPKKKAEPTEAIPETVIMSLDDLKGRK